MSKKIVTGDLERHFQAAKQGVDLPIEEKVVNSDNQNSNIKQAQYGGDLASSKIMYTQPQFYSPVHTPTNWQIPSKRREVYLWNRFFASNEPKIAASLRFYSQFPFSGFNHNFDDPIRLEHFDNLRKRIRLDHWLPLIAYEYFSMGDVFPFVSFYCSDCKGVGVSPNGKQCKHKGGMVSKISILNPDWVEVRLNPMDPDNPSISLVPDDTLKQIVFSKKPPEIYESIPPHFRKMIAENRPIPLSKRSVTHLKHDEIAYQPYGRSIIASLFPTLAYQDKLRQAQWIVAERHILPIKVVKVGNDTKPASASDIADVQSQLGASANDPNLALVTHHAFNFEFVGASGKVLQLTKEWDLIDKAIIQGLGVNEALLSGQGPSYAQAAIGIEATIRRLNIVRQLMAEWIEEKIYKPEAEMQGFYTEDKDGNKILHYPKIKWDDLNLRDETQKNQFYLQLWDKGMVSTQFMLEKMGIDYEEETAKVRMEQQYQQQLGIAPQPGPGGIGGGGPKRPPVGGKPMGGGFGGGPKGPGAPGDEMKGNLPGGKSGPGLPGDELAPSMSGGETMASSDNKIVTGQFSDQKVKDIEMAKSFVPLVRNPGKFKLQDLNDGGKIQPWEMEEPEPEEPFEFYEGPRTGAFRPNNLEASLYAAVADAQGNGNLPLDFVYQSKPEPERMPRITVDGMWPSLKLIIEADGKIFHSGVDEVQNNEERDTELASYGWTVLRFTEDQVKGQMPEVIKTIIESANRLNQKNNMTHEQ
jgi:hypothetical protein